MLLLLHGALTQKAAEVGFGEAQLTSTSTHEHALCLPIVCAPCC